MPLSCLLIGLLLCWDANTESDLFGYWILSAERHVEEWVVCPCEPGVPCPQHILCPVYSPFVWQWAFTGYVPMFERTDCANAPHSICYYKHPVAEDFAGNASVMPSIPDPLPRGTCP